MTYRSNNLEKLSEIQKLARAFNKELENDFERIGYKSGGNLLLGRFYAESPYIYFGLNPGSYGISMDFVANFDGKSGYNPPFKSSDDYARKGYGLRWRNFLSKHNSLFEWFNNKVTSTFLCPWRTPNGKTLENLNISLNDSLYKCSGQLVRTMIEHHDARLLILSGLKSLHLFNELMDRSGAKAFDSKTIDLVGKKKKFAKHLWEKDGIRIPILQIPHFSWPVSNATLDALAEWLGMELKPFGLQGK